MCVGRIPLSDEIQLTFDEIVQIVQFDLDNASFTVGDDVIMIQGVGIPMGSPTSSAIAPMICIYFENIYFSLQ